MTLNEFKAWFKGYDEAMATDRPTEAQWLRIKSVIDGLAPVAIPEQRASYGIIGAQAQLPHQGTPLGPINPIYQKAAP